MTPEEYLGAIIVPLVRNPADVKIVRTQDELGYLLTLTVHKFDMGVIIGKEGEMARAVRRVMTQFGGVHETRISLKIAEAQ